jgi:hypothetical protein
VERANQPRVGTGARFLASLPARYSLNQATIRRLAPKVELLLSGEFTEATLRSRLTAGIDSEHLPIGALIRRLEKLARDAAGQPPEKPPWCGQCDEYTRQRENDAGLPYRCPECHPLAVGV